ncbi:hypothetical protein chiPu_0023600, partial [Chiloscyllium punctatum]|nr:hypothetical protein [Chiloscyllium punctatum]
MGQFELRSEVGERPWRCDRITPLYFFSQAILNSQGEKFWEMPASFWDDVNNVGLRGHYICSVYAARMMVETKRGLIVIISSMGGLRYLFNVAYGVGKAA